MYCENCGRKTGNVSGLFKVLAVIAAILLALLLAGCGNDANGSGSGRDKSDDDEKETLRFETPEEQYRYVEGAVFNRIGESFAAAYDNAKSYVALTDQRVGAEMTLELFKPVTDLLESNTGIDFSWLKTLGLTEDVNLTEDGASMDLSLSLNGRELIGAELIMDLAEQTMYGRVPLLSKDYFRAELDDGGYYSSSYAMVGQLMEQLRAVLPEGKTVAKILSRCVEAALDQVDDIEEDTDKLTAGGVSAKYTTLTLTLTEDLLGDMIAAVCDELKDDKDVEDIILDLEEMLDMSIYDDFCDELDWLAKQDIRLSDEIEMTLYVDERNEVCGRVIEVGDYVLRYARPEDGKEFGFEISAENTRYDEPIFLLSGDGERSGDTIEATAVFTMDETEMFTLRIEDLDTKRLSDGELIGTFTFMPTYDFYTFAGVYSLTARALEDCSLVLESGKNEVAVTLYNVDEPMLALALREEQGRSEPLPTVSGAKEIMTWTQSLLLNGALEDYVEYLMDSDIPEELLQLLLGGVF